MYIISVSFCLKHGRNLKRNMATRKHKRWSKTSYPRLCGREERLQTPQKTILFGKSTLITSSLMMKCKAATSSSSLWRTHGPIRISQKNNTYRICSLFFTCHFFLFHISMCPPSFQMNNHRINYLCGRYIFGESLTMNTTSIFMYPRGQSLYILDQPIEPRPIINGRSFLEGYPLCMEIKVAFVMCSKKSFLCYSNLNLHDLACRTVFALSVYAKDSCA